MKKKTFIMLLCAVLVVTSAAFGTIAYLTDRASVVNTFTVGNVKITLKETDVDENGQPMKDGVVLEPDSSETPDRVTEGQTFKLIPGQIYVKDPTVTVLKGSEESYVSMVVEISKANELDALYAALHEADPANYPQTEDNNQIWFSKFVTKPETSSSYVWELVSKKRDGTNNKYELIYYLKTNSNNVLVDTTVTATDDVELPALFNTVTVPAVVTTDWLQYVGEVKVEVFGRAIQAAGFETAKDAWEAFNAQPDLGSTPPPTTEAEVPSADDDDSTT